MKYKKATRLGEWQKKCSTSEVRCKCGESRNITVDHVVPVHILECLGLDKTEIIYNMEENFEFLCRYCNQMKSGRIDPKNPKTYLVLEKVLNEAKVYYLNETL